jgi:hypothetical protein
LLVLYLKWSFELVWADHERIRARFPILQTPSHDFDFEVRSWSNAAGQPVAENLPNEAPLFDDASSPPAAPEEDLTEPLFATPATPNYYTPSAPVDVETLFNTAELPAETPAHETPEAGRFPSDHCLDLRGYSFQFINGYLYVPTLVTAILFSYAALTLLFLGLPFCFLCPLTRKRATLTLLLIPLLRVLLRKACNLLLSYCVVRNSAVYAPRTLAWLDLIFTLTWTWLIGPGTAFARFVLGCVHLLGRLVAFPVAVLPGSLCFLDPAFGSYGAVMKGRYHGVLREQPLEALAAPGGRLGLFSLQPGAFSIFF